MIVPEEMSAWIQQHFPDQPTAYGHCDRATREMVVAFPILKRVPGHVWTSWGMRSHWWCQLPDGTVVDPTAHQFPGGVNSYEEWHPGDEIRVGKCMNCGSYIWRAVESLDAVPLESVCDSDCDEAMRAAIEMDLMMSR